MSKKVFVYNKGLDKEQRIVDPLIDVYDLTNNDLLLYNWVYDNFWARVKFTNIIDEIRKVSPITISDNPRFWDQGLMGFNVYNHTIEKMSQISGMGF